MKRLPLSLIFALSACGDDSGGGSIPVESLADEFVHSYCTSAVACREFPDQATCEGSVSPDAFNLSSLQAAIDRGTVAYDGEQARACLDALFAGGDSCAYSSPPPEAPEACDRAVQGTVAAGGTCYLDDECMGDGYCDTGDCAETCCMGMCVALDAAIAQGEPCNTTSGAYCVSGSYCKPSAPDSATGTCTAQVSSGPCDAFDACKIGFCDPETMMCPNPAPEGGTCDPASYYPCDRFDNYCDPTMMKCLALKEPGDACAADASECVFYAECVGGTCTILPGEGDPCPMGTCLGTLECTSGTCTAPEPSPPCPAS